MFFDTILTEEMNPLYTDTPEKIRQCAAALEYQGVTDGLCIFVGITCEVISVGDYLERKPPLVIAGEIPLVVTGEWEKTHPAWTWK
jgi:hypothetical protein